MFALILTSCASKPELPPQQLVVTKYLSDIPDVPSSLKKPCEIPGLEGDDISIQEALESIPELRAALCKCSSRLSAVFELLEVNVKGCDHRL